MNQRVIMIDKSTIQDVMKTIEDLQEGMDVLNEESTNQELKVAYHNHGIAQGYIRCLKDLEIPFPEYSHLFMEQLRIVERINGLQEKSSSKTAI